MPKVTFACPRCGCPFFGSYNQPGGTKERFCKGPVTDGMCAWTCEFRWPESDDAKYLKTEGAS